MTAITHDEAARELAGVALGSAAGATSERVAAHLKSCRDCAAEFLKMEITARQLGELIPDHPLNPGRAAGIRSRLLSRASADTDRRAVPVTTTAASRVKPPTPAKTSSSAPAPRVREVPVDGESRRGMPGSLLAGITGIAALVAVGAVIQMLRANAEADSLRATIHVQQDTVVATPPAPSRSAVEQSRIVAAVTGADVKIITLTHYGARGPVARMFWNRETNSWTLVTYSIRQPKPDKTFQIWLSTSSGTLSGGTFVPDAAGHAIVQSTNQVGRDGLYSISVTEEPKGGVPTPTGPAVIAGAP